MSFSAKHNKTIPYPLPNTNRQKNIQRGTRPGVANNSRFQLRGRIFVAASFMVWIVHRLRALNFASKRSSVKTQANTLNGCNRGSRYSVRACKTCARRSRASTIDRLIIFEIQRQCRYGRSNKVKD